MDAAARVCDRLSIMTHGKIVDEMTPGAVHNDGLPIVNTYLG
jgi:ABC-type branched-subunit amino acid transport system ATPase component